MRQLLTLLVLAVGAPALAQDPAPTAPAEVTTAPEAQAETSPARDHTILGAALDVGIPDGAGIWAIYRPFKFLRLQLGTSTNVVSPSIRGGVSLVPFYFPITPSLNVEAGHFFDGNANRALRAVMNDPNVDIPVLRAVGYQYVTGSLGLEIGSPKRFIIFTRTGITYFQTAVKGITDAISGVAPTGDALEISDVKVRFSMPSFKLGLMFYFW